MSESEQLMVVDEAGHPLYTATRQDVHTQGLWHETFHCFVIDSIETAGRVTATGGSEKRLSRDAGYHGGRSSVGR